MTGQELVMKAREAGYTEKVNTNQSVLRQICPKCSHNSLLRFHKLNRKKKGPMRVDRCYHCGFFQKVTVKKG